jgi:hypothetical protein
MSSGYIKDLAKARNLGVPYIRLLRTQLQIQACLRKQKGRLINSQRHQGNALFGGETVSFRVRELGRSTVLCECVNVQV